MFSEFADSTNSFCQLEKDTLKLFLKTGWFEGSYSLNIKIFDNKSYTKFSLFDNYSKYIYPASRGSIFLDKKLFKINDYVTAKFNYHNIGKLKDGLQVNYDTTTFIGVIKLKIRAAEFTFEDLLTEEDRNDFFALLKQRPDTIKKLNLYGCAFTKIPPQLAYFTNLEELDLNGNDLSNCSFKLLSTLKNLKSLNLQDCKLSKFPDPILKLSKLETLNLWENKLIHIPDGLYDMLSLKDLTIGNNDLNNLSPKISNLKNLESFETSSTQIMIYPDEMIKLKKLVEIYPSDTMKYIPKPLMKYVFGCDTVLDK